MEREAEFLHDGVTMKSVCRAMSAFLMVLVLAMCAAQAPKSPETKPELLPFAFSNFAWWSNPELHGILKNRIPRLGDEIAPGSPMERRIREVLTALLKQKGI